MDRIIQKKISNKSAVRSLVRRKVKWIDQAETLLPRIAPALSAVTGNPVPALPLFSGSSSPEKTFEPLRRSEPSTPCFIQLTHVAFSYSHRWKMSNFGLFSGLLYFVWKFNQNHFILSRMFEAGWWTQIFRQIFSFFEHCEVSSFWLYSVTFIASHDKNRKTSWNIS